MGEKSARQQGARRYCWRLLSRPTDDRMHVNHALNPLPAPVITINSGVVFGRGGMFAMATFLLGGSVTQSIGEVRSLVCVVAIGAVVTYFGGRVAPRNAA